MTSRSVTKLSMETYVKLTLRHYCLIASHRRQNTVRAGVIYTAANDMHPRNS
jgi:hypothetical protein